MKVLVYSHSAAGVTPVVNALKATEHSLDSAVTVESAVARLAQSPVDVVLLEWRAQEPPTPLVEAIRGRHARTGMVAMVESPTTAVLDSIIDAGVHDILRKPFLGREIAFRIENAARLARSPADVLGGDRVATDGLQAWTQLETLASTELSGMLGEPMVPKSTAPDGALFVSKITLVYGEGRATVELTVGLDEATLAKLATTLLNATTVDDALRKDITGEIANTLGGAFQRWAEEESETITIGLPTVGPRRKFRPADPPGRAFVLGGVSSALRVVIFADLHRPHVEHVRPERLREGMVLTRDILGEKGALIIARGTRLTEVNAERLGRILPPDSLVQVTIAA